MNETLLNVLISVDSNNASGEDYLCGQSHIVDIIARILSVPYFLGLTSWFDEKINPVIYACSQRQIWSFSSIDGIFFVIMNSDQMDSNPLF